MKPCKDCPFSSEVGSYLNLGKRLDIDATISNDGSFHCHKTVDYSQSNEGRVTPDSKLCFGSALYLEKNARGGMRSNVQYRLRFMSGEWKLENLHDIDLENIPSRDNWLA